MDGFGAGLGQSQSEPFGKNAFQIMSWFLTTRTFKSMVGAEGGSTGLDDSHAAGAFEGIGAFCHGSQHVQPSSRPLGQRGLEGLVG